MTKARLLGIGIATCVLAGLGWSFSSSPEPTGPAATTTVGQPRTTLLDEVVFTRETSKGQVAELIASGSHQLAGQAIADVSTFRRVRDSEALDYDTSYGFSAELTFNVAGPEFLDGRINPFHHQAFREAVNWLVDRRHVAEELYGGLAVPRYSLLPTSIPDNARLAETVRQLELKYKYQPEKARKIFEGIMADLGAEKQDGKWHHDGKPVLIKVLIRTEDQRQLVGDYVADQFQDLGFAVERMYRSASEATRFWLSGNPDLGEWHIYTGGWGANFIIRDYSANFNYYYTSRGRPGALWQRYRPVPEFDEVSGRLGRAEYADWDERQALMRRALQLAMEDSARVWLVDVISAWIRSPAISLATDLAAGHTGSQLWPYTLRYKDRLGGQVKLAMPTVLGEPFNPIAGTNWGFDNMVLRGLANWPVLPDPYTGLFRPQQLASARVTVKRDAVVNATLDWVNLERVAEIEVPGDTWIDWDHENTRWITVAEKYPQGLTSHARVRIEYPPDFLQGRWHDGSKRSLADMVLPWILTFERTNPASPMYDTALVPSFTSFQKTFHGRRIVSTDPLVIEYYGGVISPDAETMVATRAPGRRGTSGLQDTGVPWHTLGLAIRSETQGELALSSTKADLNRVEWTNFVDGPTLEIFRRHLQQARDTGYLPYANVLKDLVTPDEIASRYQNLTDWLGERGHFWVGDGPYYLHAVHAIEGSLVLRPSAYFQEPLDKWLAFDKPRIPAFDITGPMIVRQGEGADFFIDVRFAGKPYPTKDLQNIKYLVFNRESQMTLSGSATLATDNRWQVRLDDTEIARLGIGGNRLEVIVTASPVAMPIFGTHGFATIPGDAAGASELARVDVK